jgi:hypothetical protein
VKFVTDRLRGKTFVKKRTYLHNLQQQTGLIRFWQGKLEHYLVILIKVLIEKFSKTACYSLHRSQLIQLQEPEYPFLGN